MLELFLIVLIGFSAVWGSIFLGAYLKRLSRAVDARPDDLVIEGMREDAMGLEIRLARVEEELEFLRQLHGPAPQARIEGPGGGATSDDGAGLDVPKT